METKLKIKFISIFVILMIALIIVSAQEELTIVSEELIANNDVGDLVVEGGTVVLTTV